MKPLFRQADLEKVRRKEFQEHLKEIKRVHRTRDLTPLETARRESDWIRIQRRKFQDIGEFTLTDPT